MLACSQVTHKQDMSWLPTLRVILCMQQTASTSISFGRFLTMASFRTSTIILTLELVVTTSSLPLGAHTAYKSFLEFFVGRLVVILELLASQILASVHETVDIT